MSWDWILLRIGPNVQFKVSKWHLIASKYPKFAGPLKGQFPAKPFISKRYRLPYAFTEHYCAVVSYKQLLMNFFVNYFDYLIV